MSDRDKFPFMKPVGSDLDMFIQWKGTDLCADFTCGCGYQGHLDSDFAHYVRCGGCGAVYEMGCQVIARRVDPEDAHIPSKPFTASVPVSGDQEGTSG